VSITLVLDLIHVIHYLWTIALLLCGGVHKEADGWVGHILVQLLTRHPLDVVATIRQTATNRRLNAADRKALTKNTPKSITRRRSAIASGWQSRYPNRFSCTGDRTTGRPTR